MDKQLRIPYHVAIIMDGNNRWAKENFLPKKMGHKKGAEAAERAIKLCKKYGVSYLTLYTFSSENWNRPNDEVQDLMNLLRDYLKNEVPKLIEEGVKIRFIGDRTKLDQDIADLCNDSELSSKDNKFCLIIALSYGSRQEIQIAATKLAKKALEQNEIADLKIEDFLETCDIPDPELLIRTGGDQRISNFLLWQLAYTELYFTEAYWPAFDEKEFLKALKYYSSVDRRFGGRNEAA